MHTPQTAGRRRRIMRRMATDNAPIPRNADPADAQRSRAPEAMPAGGPPPTAAPLTYEAVARLNPELEPFIFFGF